ncbi:hypothetical protein TWF225_000688 [Orbilia oligospora]|nr:hypothetical protein TWF225_000688 [Orbilia oligospora]KAF3237221.1 hypothetical protein TWF128_000986 [Orbilia oligospora]KAF3242357.1 hypothetical protein TWF217_011783 [Orbilia oligospora]
MELCWLLSPQSIPTNVYTQPSNSTLLSYVDSKFLTFALLYITVKFWRTPPAFPTDYPDHSPTENAQSVGTVLGLHTGASGPKRTGSYLGKFPASFLERLAYTALRVVLDRSVRCICEVVAAITQSPTSHSS